MKRLFLRLTNMVRGPTVSEDACEAASMILRPVSTESTTFPTSPLTAPDVVVMKTGRTGRYAHKARSVTGACR
jgi:hypothetical protein